MSGQTPMSEADADLLVADIGARARAATAALGKASAAAKTQGLHAAAERVRSAANALLDANAGDCARAETNGISAAFLDRLRLTPERIEGIASGLDTVADRPDPVGMADQNWTPANGLHISRVRVPLGVIGVIYESRPNVTADAGGLCVKAGNAAVLRGGSDSFETSGLLVRCLQDGLAAAGLPQDAVQRIPSRDRAAVGAMLRCPDCCSVTTPKDVTNAARAAERRTAKAMARTKAASLRLRQTLQRDWVHRDPNTSNRCVCVCVCVCV